MDQLRNWISGTASQQEQAELQDAAAQDPFLAEALEGIELFPDEPHVDRLRRSRQRLRKRYIKKNRTPVIWWVSRAAAVIVLAVGLGWVLQQTAWQSMESASMAMEQKSSENESSAQEEQSTLEFREGDSQLSLEMTEDADETQNAFSYNAEPNTDAAATSPSEQGQIAANTPPPLKKDAAPSAPKVTSSAKTKLAQASSPKPSASSQGNVPMNTEKEADDSGLPPEVVQDEVLVDAEKPRILSSTSPPPQAEPAAEESYRIPIIEQDNTSSGSTISPETARQLENLPETIVTAPRTIQKKENASSVIVAESEKKEKKRKKRKKKKAKDSRPRSSAPIELRGTIFDENGEPLIGASILQTGTDNGTVSDFEGRFQLPILNDADQQIEVAYVGYSSKSIDLDGQTKLDIVMDNQAVLSEVVVSSTGRRDSPSEPLISRKAKPRKGFRKFKRYIEKNRQIPAAAKEAGIKGEVVLVFGIDAKGRPQNIQVIQSLGYGCDEEAIRLLREGPDWRQPLPNRYGTVEYKVSFE